ncbi:ATP-binding protein [Pyrolobus fumarii]|uniref:ATP-binding protein n=1 Tax=Pyrolobus fumarii TaxID=54252 RepID=UPI000A92D8C6|nr:ATP-binding protein [Pyrolobus fumarii]
MPLHPRIRRMLGEEIGVVLSGATSVTAPIAVRKEHAPLIREDLMVAVHDEHLGNDVVLIGVLRFVTRYEPFLRRGIPNVYTSYPQALTNDLLAPFTNAYIELYGVARFELEDESASVIGKIEPPVYAPHPGSRVYIITGPELLDAIVGGRGLRVGVHPFTGWSPPIDPEALKMHVGVFGATGMGKSRLVRRLAREASRHYAVIIFDHSGVDYAPVAEKLGYPVVPANRVQLDVITMTEMLAEIMDVPSTLQDYVLAGVYCHDGLVKGKFSTPEQCLRESYMTTRMSAQRSRQYTWNKEEFISTLLLVAKRLGARDTTLLKLRLYAERVPNYIYESFGGRDVSPREIIQAALDHNIVVVDLGREEEIAAKRAIVAQVVDEAWKIIHETLQPINVAVFVDEAQHYACEYCRPSATRLEKIAREGRKWGLWLLVASQRVSRDIKPGIRANLGTVFFSRLQATGDLQELGGYLDLGNVTQASLAMLDRRQFYLAGLANPLRKPVLIQVEHVPDDGF